jgi:hypothetical protein
MEKPVDGPRERDQSVERLLRQSLEMPQRAGVTDSCLDAETLAAWIDGRLSGAALEAAQLHVADCTRCQHVVGTLARIHSTGPQAEPVHASRRWLAWLVPLTAAAAAVALWVALPGNPGGPGGDIKTAPVAQAPQDKIAELRTPEGAPPETRPQASPAIQTPLRPERKDARQEPAVAGTATKTKEVASNDAAKNEVASAAPPAAPAAPAAVAAAPPPQPAERVGRLAQSTARDVQVAPTEIVSPDPNVRWRIVGSAVQHSSNGGSTWEAASTGMAAELTAGAAPSASVCWLVGRVGVVLRTTDGRTWRRVPFPEMTDLSAVRATDAGGNLASVSTADGRTFSTTDGGVTWASR